MRSDLDVGVVGEFASRGLAVRGMENNKGLLIDIDPVLRSQIGLELATR